VAGFEWKATERFNDDRSPIAEVTQGKEKEDWQDIG
jgi:hypothetical protein